MDKHGYFKQMTNKIGQPGESKQTTGIHKRLTLNSLGAGVRTSQPPNTQTHTYCTASPPHVAI